MPEPRTSLEEIQLALERVASRENRGELYRTPGRPGRGSSSSPAPAGCSTGWPTSPTALDEVAERLKVDPSVLAPGVDELCQRGYVARQGGPGGELRLTEQGDDAVRRLADARRAGMNELLEGWDPEAHPEVVEMVRDLAHNLLADDEKLLADARSAAVV